MANVKAIPTPSPPPITGVIALPGSMKASWTASGGTSSGGWNKEESEGILEGQERRAEESRERARRNFEEGVERERKRRKDPNWDPLHEYEKRIDLQQLVKDLGEAKAIAVLKGAGVTPGNAAHSVSEASAQLELKPYVSDKGVDWDALKEKYGEKGTKDLLDRAGWSGVFEEQRDTAGIKTDPSAILGVGFGGGKVGEGVSWITEGWLGRSFVGKRGGRDSGRSRVSGGAVMKGVM